MRKDTSSPRASGSLGERGIPGINSFGQKKLGAEHIVNFRVTAVYSNGKMEENMKKLFLLFVVYIVVAFSMPAFAADIKFFGEYYVAGYYSSNYSLNDQNNNNESRATYGQRLRINTVFQVSEGLKLTTRFDAMERGWGQENSLGTPNPTATYPSTAAAGAYGTGTGTNPENNISFERAYVTFNLGPGFFDVGYQAEGYWSPIAFGNTTGSQGIIRYTALLGPVTLSAYTQKVTETEFDPAVYEPGDYDRYAVQGTYKWKSGQAGIQALWENLETGASPMTFHALTNSYSVAAGSKLNYYEISPFFQAKLGPVDWEGKAYWSFGSIDNKANSGLDKDIEGFSAYTNAKINIGPAYVGGMFAYIKGQNPTDTDNVALSHGGGQDWDACLILGNDKYSKWQGGRYARGTGWNAPAGNAGPFAANGSTTASARTYDEKNAFIYQGYVGAKPIPALALRASFTYWRADQNPNGYDDHIGNEFDLTANYKIYPNLEYMIGFGYLWAGDWFKGTSNTSIDDTYLLMHQLTLTF